MPAKIGEAAMADKPIKKCWSTYLEGNPSMKVWVEANPELAEKSKKKFDDCQEYSTLLIPCLCTSKWLDPLTKEIWCVARGGKPTFMLSIDGFLKLVNSTGQLDGIDSLQWLSLR